MLDASTVTTKLDAEQGVAATEQAPPIRGPWRMAWRSFRRHRPAMVGLWVLGVLYVVAIFADFVAPYHYDNQVRDLLWAKPTRLHFKDAAGFSWRPFIYPVRSFIDENFDTRQQEDTSKRCYLRWLVKGDAYKLLGVLPARTRLFGFDEVASSKPDEEKFYSRYYLFGADVSGRDIFSRICYGARISMTIGLVGVVLVFAIGLLIGGASGFFPGRVDVSLQSISQMVMLLPGFYLLLMLRFTFPSSMDSTQVYFAVILILSLVGWPRLALVVRGMVLSIRQQDFVQAGRAIGLGSFRIIVRHVLPNTMSYVVVALTLSIPGYILGESGLSLLGLGIMEPTPSWGNMLQKAMDIVELDQHPWVLWPGAFIFLAVMAFNLVGDGLRDALDPKMRKVQ